MITLIVNDLGKSKYFVIQNGKRAGFVSQAKNTLSLSCDDPVTLKKSLTGHWVLDRIFSVFFLAVMFVLLVLSGEGISNDSPEDEMVYLELTALPRENIDTLQISKNGHKLECEGAESSYRIIKTGAYMVALSYAFIVSAVFAVGCFAVALGAIESNMVSLAIGIAVLALAVFSAISIAKKFIVNYRKQLRNCLNEIQKSDDISF